MIGVSRSLDVKGSSARLPPKKKGLGVLLFELMVLPLAVNNIVLKHAGHAISGDERIANSKELNTSVARAFLPFYFFIFFTSFMKTPVVMIKKIVSAWDAFFRATEFESTLPGRFCSYLLVRFGQVSFFG